VRCTHFAFFDFAEIGDSRSGGALPTRSSSRIASAKLELEPEIHISLPDSWDEGAEPNRRKRTAAAAADGGLSDQGSVTSKKSAHLKPRKVLSSDSSRNLIAELDVLHSIVGESVPGGHIKAGVMQFVSPNHEPKFSKYTGMNCS
jgi:hypothetical protein